ncbi:MAG: hypothetical protein V2A73_05180, partial [Pseudomonadota bacterium]
MDRFFKWLRSLASGGQAKAHGRGRDRPGPNAASLPRIPFKLRYGYFREILAANDRILELIADVEDKLSGERVFGMAELRSSLEAATLAAFVIAKNLNLISANRHTGLYDSLERIDRQIREELGLRTKDSKAASVVPLAVANRQLIDAVGGKMANLAEVKRLGLAVPDGFVITT